MTNARSSQILHDPAVFLDKSEKEMNGGRGRRLGTSNPPPYSLLPVNGKSEGAGFNV